MDNATLRTDENNKIYYEPYHLDDGNYTFKAYHMDDSYYSYVGDCEGEFTLKRNYSSTVTINIEDNAEFEYGSSSDIPFTITNRTEVRVIITNADGRAVFNKTTSDDFEMLDLAAGDYNITVYNLGNKTHAPSKDSKLFKILKVLIEAADAKYGLGDSYAYGAKFVLENGTAFANKTVTFKINGATYNATTDENGTAKVTLTSLNAGSYDMVISYLDEKATQKITVSPRIVESKDLIMDYDSNSFTVKAIGDDGNPIANEVVKMSVNGVTYNIKTDKNCVAHLPIKLKPKTYTITCSYKGTTVKNTIKVKFTLKAKKTVKVKKTAKKLVLKATLKWSNGKAIVGKKITFKFKGKIYTVKTNKKGLAKVIIKKKVLKKLKKGKTYKANIIYKNETVTTKVKVKK